MRLYHEPWSASKCCDSVQDCLFCSVTCNLWLPTSYQTATALHRIASHLSFCPPQIGKFYPASCRTTYFISFPRQIIFLFIQAPAWSLLSSQHSSHFSLLRIVSFFCILICTHISTPATQHNDSCSPSSCSAGFPDIECSRLSRNDFLARLHSLSLFFSVQRQPWAKESENHQASRAL